MRGFLKPVLVLLFLTWPARAEIVDRLLAVVGNQAITWSSLRAEANYDAFLNDLPLPPRSLANVDDTQGLQKILSGMVDQTLLQQEMDLYGFTLPEDGETQRRLDQVRSRFPDPAAYQQTLERYELTERELVDRLRRESALLAFLQYRLRPQVRLDPSRVESYYRDVLLPQLDRQGGKSPPPLAEVREQIEQILVQQEMDRLLEDWMKRLRNRAKIKILL